MRGDSWPVAAMIAVAYAQNVAATTTVADHPAFPVLQYAFATALALLGIVARHAARVADEIVKNGNAAKFSKTALAFDCLTSPMLGITLSVLCSYAQIDPTISDGLVVFGAFLGPEWMRTLGTGLADILLRRGKP